MILKLPAAAIEAAAEVRRLPTQPPATARTRQRFWHCGAVGGAKSSILQMASVRSKLTPVRTYRRGCRSERESVKREKRLYL